MNQDIRTACIDCTKYQASDRLGNSLALLCHAAYLSVVYLVSVFYAKRDIKDGAILVGAVVNAGVGRALKSIWRQPRPSARCALLGKCDSYGMPSSHTQVVAYIFAASLILKLATQAEQSKMARVLAKLESLSLGFLTLIVAYARVYLGYHSPFQTFIGGILGFVVGVVWAYSVVKPLTRNGTRILKDWPLLKALGCQVDQRQQASLKPSKTVQ